MPGPSVWRGKNLQHAITSGKVSRYTLDKRVKEVLDLVNWCAGSGVKENAHEGGRDTPETSAFLRKIAADAIVLMKNEKSLLPLKKDKKVQKFLPILNHRVNVVLDPPCWPKRPCVHLLWRWKFGNDTLLRNHSL